MADDSEILRKTLSLNMKRYRKMLNVSQEKLAALVNLSSQTINDIEGCRMWVSDKTMVKLARAFQIETYQLLIPVARDNTGDNSDSKEEKPSKTEILLALRDQVKKNVDRQFADFIEAGGIG